MKFFVIIEGRNNRMRLKVLIDSSNFHSFVKSLQKEHLYNVRLYESMMRGEKLKAVSVKRIRKEMAISLLKDELARGDITTDEFLDTVFSFNE